MKDQTRNLNPTRSAIIAMWIWGKDYAKFKGGSMDFFDQLDPERQMVCSRLSIHWDGITERLRGVDERLKPSGPGLYIHLKDGRRARTYSGEGARNGKVAAYILQPGKSFELYKENGNCIRVLIKTDDYTLKVYIN